MKRRRRHHHRPVGRGDEVQVQWHSFAPEEGDTPVVGLSAWQCSDEVEHLAGVLGVLREWAVKAGRPMPSLGWFLLPCGCTMASTPEGLQRALERPA